MTFITDIYARQILDSRGNPTVEAEVVTDEGVVSRAAVPSGASTGIKEAVELRDNDKKNFGGKGVLKAVQHINTTIKKALIDVPVENQLEIDQIMITLDGTPNKSKLGANAILAVSLAVAKAAAIESGLPLYKYIGGINAKTLPVPAFNIINGGVHADNKIDFQEFMIAPVGASSFSEAFRWGSEIFHTLRGLLKKKGYSTNVGDEGGFAPNMQDNEEAVEMIIEAIQLAGYKPGIQVGIMLDPASSEFWDIKEKKYTLKKSTGKKLSIEEMVAYYESWVKKYKAIVSIEDAMAENDTKGWALITEKLGNVIQLVGDDLFVTNPSIIQQGIDNHLANAVLIKVNQIGTLSETINAVEIAHRNGYKTMMSHRSGETEDTFIADLAVALNCGQMKTGSLCRSERIAKYNQLLRIEESLGTTAIYPAGLALRK